MQTSDPRPALISLTFCAVLLLAACGNGDEVDSSPEPDESFAEAELADVAGNDVGRISFAEEETPGVADRLSEVSSNYQGIVETSASYSTLISQQPSEIACTDGATEQREHLAVTLSLLGSL
jgi:hypothetical protein